VADELNTVRGKTVKADCLCRGRNSRCVMCNGDGHLVKKSCLRCGGMGKDGGAKCPDCKGRGWRDIDNMTYLN
jgi:hypothetical protein